MDNALFLLGTVASVSTTHGVRIQIDGQDVAMSKYYKMLLTGAGAPSVGDRVVIMKHSGTYVVLGRIGVPSDDGGSGADKVSKSGDTMTGALIMDDAHHYMDTNEITIGTRPGSNKWSKRISFRDSAKKVFARLQGYQGTNGDVGVQLIGEQVVNGENKVNYLGLYMNDSGSGVVDLYWPSAWRKALGLGNTSGSLPITVAQGGTGAATAAAKTVFAGPSSGSPAAPSFRTLTSADLPPISLDNFTGVLPVDNGGTGATAVTTTSVVSEIVTAASGFATAGATCSVWGKIITIRVNMRATQAVTGTGWNTVATIVSGKRPTMYFALSDPNNRKMQITGSSGNLQVYGAIAKDEEFNFTATYLLA